MKSTHAHKALAALAAIMLTQAPAWGLCQQGSFLEPQGPIASGQMSHMIEVTILVLVAVVPVFVLLPILLFRFRRRGGKGAYKPHWESSMALEGLMWGIPVIIVVIICRQMWTSTHELDPGETLSDIEETIEVQVVGLNWKWLFIYQDLGIASVGELAIPTGTAVKLELTTDTVMQSLLIPALVGQIYAMPGMVTRVNLLADEAGRMKGMNTQYNGDGFTGQEFATLAMDPRDFQGWVAKVRENGVPLDKARYRTLARQSTRIEAHRDLGTGAMPEGVLYFTLPDATLFQTVVGRYRGAEDLGAETQPGSKEFDRPATKGGAE